VDFIRPFRHGSELNQNELWKLERHPLDVADAIRERYAALGPDSIARVPGEVERLKWVGLYPQRQGGDAFMMRVKVPAGRLTAGQARVIGQVTEEHAHGPEPHPVWGDRYCDITTRQTLQLHWLHIADVPEIWRRFEEVGLTTVQACGDSARNVSCCPVAGVDADEAFDASPIATAISAYFTGNREYANLPRKFKISVTGCLDDCARAEINDVGMWPARSRDGALGFNLLVGGGLSDGPRMASDLDLFVAPEDAVECCRAIAQLFGELGNRENRGVSRLRYLVQELGPEGFRDELESRASFAFQPAGEALTRGHRGDHVGVHRQHRDASSPGETYYVGCSVLVGRLRGADLVELSRLAETYGDGTVRLTTDQNLVLTGVAEERLADLLAEDVLVRHSPFPGPFSRGAVACTGTEFCRFAIVETKLRAAEWATEMDRRFAPSFAVPGFVPEGPYGSDGPVVRTHFSGCSASCAQPQIADIAFRGDTAHVGDEIVEAVDIGLGGSLGLDAAFADWTAGAVPVEDVPGALANVVGRYLAERREGERFHGFVRRVDAPSLRATLCAGAPSSLARERDPGSLDPGSPDPGSREEGGS
jgi:ferredoxin-nitrite reductase